MSWELADLRAPLIGRHEEMAQLKRAVDEMRAQGEPRYVTLVGGGGVGKTRLVQELLAELRTAGVFVPRVFKGSGTDLQLSYGIFSRLLRSRFGIQDGMSTEESRQRVRGQVAEVLQDRKVEDVAHFLGQLMGIDFLESPLTRAVADDASQARTLRRAIVRSFFEADAERGPLCLIFEDLHNADDDSLELLGHLMDNTSGHVIFICLARPELLSRSESYRSFGSERHAVLELGPLDDGAAREMARQLLARAEGGAPDEIIDAAVRPAGGSPGLIEQMVRIFFDVGVLVEEDPLAEEPVWKVNLTQVASARLPLTVEEAVAARIAALAGPDRRLLEFGATMGSVFWLGGVVALSRMDQDAPELWNDAEIGDVEEIEERLEDLVRRDYLLRLPDSGFPDETEFVFKHNLEREKIASLTSAAAARGYHRALADWLSQKASVRSGEEYMAMLGKHLELAGSTARAGTVFLDAGDIARGGYGAKKAQEYYRKGLELLGDQDSQRRIDALHNHGDVLLLLGKSDEALSAFRQMLTLAFRLGLRGKGGAAHNRIGRLYRDMGDLQQSTQHLETARELFQSVSDRRGVAACHDDLGRVLWLKGDYDRALKEMKVALETRKVLGDRRSIALSLNNIGLVWADHGRVAKAQEALEAALLIQREINDPLGIVQSLNNLGKLAKEQGESGRAQDLFQEALAVASELGERNRIAIVHTQLGTTLLGQGKSDEGIEHLKKAEAICDDLGDKLNLAEAKRSLAEAYLGQGELRKARESIKLAVDLFGQVRGKAHLASALRTLGDVTAAGAWGQGHEGKAVDYYMRSIALCKEIGNELETAKSYRAFSRYVTSSPHYKDNEKIQREAARLEQLAQEIFERQLVARQRMDSHTQQ